MTSTFVYRLFDAKGGLLCIGCTGNVSRRIDQHLRKGTGGGELIADYTSEEYPDRATALKAESAAILLEQPPVNIRQKMRRGVDLTTAGDRYGAFGEQLTWNIAQRMLARPVGLVQFAREIGVPYSRFNRALGTGNFSVDELAAIADHLGLTFHELIHSSSRVSA